MKPLSIAILAVLILVSCTGGGGGGVENPKKFEVYISSFKNYVLKLSMNGEDWSFTEESIGIEPTGVLTKVDNKILIPSSNVIYETNGSSSIVFEGEDVFKKALIYEGTIVALGNFGIKSALGEVEGNFEDFCVAGGKVFAVSDLGIELIDLENSRSTLVESGDFTTLECEEPYLYAGYDGGVVEFLIEGDELLESADYRTDFVVSSIFVNDDGVYVGGDGGIVFFTTLGSSYTLFDSQVDDVYVGDGVIFLVSGMRNSFEILDVSDPENPKTVLSESLALYKPSIVVRGE